MILLFPMTLEKILVCALLAAALLPLARWLRSTAWRVGLTVLFLGCVGATLVWQQRIETREQARAALREKSPRQSRHDGYAGSETCKSCHPNPYASWHNSYHRTMTQYPSSQSVSGKFDHVTLELNGDLYHLERRGEEFRVDMVDPDWSYVRILQRAAHQKGQAKEPPPVANPPRKNLPISLLTGSHHMQAYWVPSHYGNMQFGFPFTYLFEAARWVPRDDVFLFPPHGAFTMQVWNVNCIACHATAGQPRQDPRTKIIDTHAAEMGIACEACHGPAAPHVTANLDPTRRYARHRAGGPDGTIFNPARQNHVMSSEACGQCHAIRHKLSAENWNQRGPAFRPGGNLEADHPLVHYDGTNLHAPGNEKKRALMEGSFWSDGMVRVSGREFNGLAASGCFKRGELSCLSCHSLHQYTDPDDQLAAGMDGNPACLQCHAEYAANLERHTHHPVGSSGSLCYNCHMPHTSYGLLKGIRSHHINSPTVKASLATGRPNACNLCHLDKTLAWSGRKLNAWYGQPVEQLSPEQETTSAAVLWALTGDAGQRALIAWHLGWQPAKEVSGNGWLAPHLAQLLEDPYSAVRYIAQRSLKRLPGYEQFSFDYIGPAAARLQARRQALDIWSKQAKPVTGANSEVLLDPAGALQQEEVARLLRQRNDRRVELLE